MGSRDVTMEIKYAAMFASVQAGNESVTELCARLGISRKSYYKYRPGSPVRGWRGCGHGRGGRCGALPRRHRRWWS
jgi:hypothetical protein